MDYTKLAATAAKAVGTAIKKDRANRYSLTEDWTLPPVATALLCIPPWDYDGEVIRCRKLDAGHMEITVRKYASTNEQNVCDGASLAPDWKGALEGSLFHDPWYSAMEDMAAKTGRNLHDVRLVGDAVFGAIIDALANRPWYARIYYTAVRWFGGIFHKLALVLVLLALGGCAGCAIPDVFYGEDVTTPTFEKTDAGTENAP